MLRTCIIAEIGTSHQGDLPKAVELILAAKEAGADVAKFQWVYADEIIHPKTGIVQLPTGAIPLYDRFKELEQGPEFFARLKESCDRVGIEFLCTPFGMKSAMQLWALGVRRFKIASPELNHLPLIELLAATGLDLIVSSGVSRIGDIEEALETIRAARKGHLPHLEALCPETAAEVLRRMPTQAEATGRLGTGQLGSLSHGGRVTLLHCITSYPAPESEYNLLLLRSLREVFGVETGLSDHSLDPVLVPAVTAALGGTMVEKHFTLSNDTDGLDDPIALNPAKFKTMVDAVRKVEACVPRPAVAAAGQSTAVKAEHEVVERLGAAGLSFDPEKVRNLLGTGVKALAPSERENYGRTNRSIHALRALKAGTLIRAEDLAIIRTEKVLRPGIHPRHAASIIGKRLSADVPDGEGIRWIDLMS
jgi:N-acetylneuraminate synthase